MPPSPINLSIAYLSIVTPSIGSESATTTSAPSFGQRG
jgi:hypothetical protein